MIPTIIWLYYSVTNSHVNYLYDGMPQKVRSYLGYLSHSPERAASDTHYKEYCYGVHTHTLYRIRGWISTKVIIRLTSNLPITVNPSTPCLCTLTLVSRERARGNIPKTGPGRTLAASNTTQVKNLQHTSFPVTSVRDET